MELKNFSELVKEEVEKRISGSKVRINEVTKNNGLILQGITIIEGESNVSPTIYLNCYHEAYENGRITIIDSVNDVIDTYQKNRVKGNIDMKYFMDYSKVKDKIVYKLVNTEKNKALLMDIPHVEYLDLSVVFQCLVTNDNESVASILIHNSHAKMWNVSSEDLYMVARENTQKLLGYQITNMNDIVHEIINSGDVDEYLGEGDTEGIANDGIHMYIVTNNNRIDGATCIIYPNLLSDLALTLGTGFYVIPSSVHEVLVVPSCNTSDGEEIKNMIREINNTQVKQEEILSYSLYYFDKESKKMFIVKD